MNDVPDDVSERDVLGYAGLGATDSEIAAILGCSEKALAERFGAVLARRRAEWHVLLRTWQRAAAKGGNVTMLIWLGRNYLGQRNESEEDDASSRPRLVKSGIPLERDS